MRGSLRARIRWSTAGSQAATCPPNVVELHIQTHKAHTHTDAWRTRSDSRCGSGRGRTCRSEQWRTGSEPGHRLQEMQQQQPQPPRRRPGSGPECAAREARAGDRACRGSWHRVAVPLDPCNKQKKKNMKEANNKDRLSAQ